ncbi:SMP-30/gluconolactonase/LRE family protein [Pseudonocardiaceae bacterium YIM PH 21723]|nr:SMP-30/gluconolactonase/LRE family protein [Pseudonocardiaceae bacterium YIM PH 21723]
MQPVVWQPPASRTGNPRPLTGLSVIELDTEGPEDVVLDAQGRIVTGVKDGRIFRMNPDGSERVQIADTGGRPLGVELFPDGRLLVCDAHRGLLAVDPETGEIQTLTDLTHFCNNAAVAADGVIYFSDTSQRWGMDDWKGDIVEHSTTGRLLKLVPGGEPEVLIDGLAFANGVALAPDGSWVAVAETGAYCVRRLWLTGPKAGTQDMLIDQLDGFPDNMSTGGDGLIWIAMAGPRDAALDWMLSKPGWLRKIVWALPEALQPKPQHVIWVLAVDLDGRVVHEFRGDHPKFYFSTGVREHGGVVFLGSESAPALGSIRIAD